MAMQAMNLSVIFVLVVRYLSIYHGALVNEVNEETVLKNINRALIIGPLVMTFYEYHDTNAMKSNASFQLLSKQPIKFGSPTEMSSNTAMIFMTVTALILYSRMEIDRKKFNAIIPEVAVAEPEVNDAPYKLSAIRLSLIVGLLLMSVVLFNVTIGVESLKVNFLLFYVIQYCFIPWVFVWNHQGMRTKAVKFMKRIENFYTIFLW